jgi:hypothetical protein
MNKGAVEMRLLLRGAVRDEAISVCGQRLLRSARNDPFTLCHPVGVLSHSPKDPGTSNLINSCGACLWPALHHAGEDACTTIKRHRFLVKSERREIFDP